MADVQFQVSKPQRNELDGKWYHRIRWVSGEGGEGRVHHEEVVSDFHQARLFDPSDQNRVWLLFRDLAGSLGLSSTSLVTSRRLRFGWGGLLLGLLNTARNQIEWEQGNRPADLVVPYAVWPGTDEPWNRSMTGKDARPRLMDKAGSASADNPQGWAGPGRSSTLPNQLPRKPPQRYAPQPWEPGDPSIFKGLPTRPEAKNRIGTGPRGSDSSVTPISLRPVSTSAAVPSLTRRTAEHGVRQQLAAVSAMNRDGYPDDAALDQRIAELRRISRETPHLITRDMEAEHVRLIEAQLARKPAGGDRVSVPGVLAAR